MIQRMHLIRLALFCLALAGCSNAPESARGFSLPDGDPAAGQEAFVALGCPACHVVSGVDLPDPAAAGPVSIELGGRISRVKTYGDLVTSVINPSHRLLPGYPTTQVTRQGESVMPVLNDIMTVQQLVDIVAFLQANYEVVSPRFVYPSYRYRELQSEEE